MTVKRLLVASSCAPDRPSGINAYVRALVEGLRHAGMEVHLFSPQPLDSSWLERHEVHHLSMGCEPDPSQPARELLRYIGEHAIDGVINNDTSLVQSVAPWLECPMVSVGHLGKTSIAALACYNKGWIDYVVAISSDMQRLFVNRYGVPVAKCPVVHNGVADPSADFQLEGAAAGVLKVVFAGGVGRRKGADLVLASIARNAVWANVELDWFGEVPAKVQARVSGLKRVTFHGRVPQPEMHGVLRNADVFLLPSRAEGCPMALLEAMSFGVVPIVSDGEGAMRWIVGSGESGFVCPLRSLPTQLAGCLEFLIRDPQMLGIMKTAARRRYLDEFQNTHTAQRLLQLLNAPTVERGARPARIRLLREHRPRPMPGKRMSLIDRAAFRLGLLRGAGFLESD